MPRYLVCGICGKSVSGGMSTGVAITAWAICQDCIKKISGDMCESILATLKSSLSTPWHIGIFEDLGLESGITIDNRLRTASLDRLMPTLIPDSDLDSKFFDIGCNCGHYLRRLWDRGARNLRGTEPRKEHVDFAQKWIEILGADVDIHRDRAESVKAEELDDTIVLVLGLIYHLNRPELLLQELKDSKMKYAILESQIWPREELCNERNISFQNSCEDTVVWHPTEDAIEKELRNVGLNYERIPFRPHCQTPRALWKVTN